MKKKEQAESSQTQSVAADEFREYIRTSLDKRVRDFAIGYVGALILEEVETLCGRTREHKRGRGLAHRGGSQQGSIVLDGIAFGGSVVIVALGVDTTGKKHIPGVSEGSTENAECALSLLRSIESRSICFTDRVLVVMARIRELQRRSKPPGGV